MKVSALFNKIQAKFVLVGTMGLAAASSNATDWTATGPSIGQIAKNGAASLNGLSAGAEALIYFFGFMFLVFFFLAAWKYKKSEGRDGNMGLIITYLVLCVGCFAAPTVVGSGTSTLFGSSPVSRVTPPPSFSN